MDNTNTSIENNSRILLNLLSEWKAFYKNRREVNYHLQVKQILQVLNYDVSKMTRDVFEGVREINGWSKRHVWPITAWNCFCKYGMGKLPAIFPNNCLLIKAERQTRVKLPKAISCEIDNIIDSHIVRTTSEKLKTESRKHIRVSFEVFLTYVLDSDPNRKIDVLSDFKEEDVLGFKDHLIATGQSPITGQRVSINTLAAFLVDLRRIFKMGYTQRKLPGNIFKDISIKKHKTAKRAFCLSKEQVEKLRTVSAGENETLKNGFERIRNNAMVSVQYEGALRAEEVVRLCWEDIPVAERVRSNVGPIIVRGSKARPAEHEDRIYVLFDRIDMDLLQWKRISEQYCKAKNIVPPAILSNSKEYHPIFFSINGSALSAGTYISNIFSSQLVKSKVAMPRGYKTHILRHSRVTHWVEEDGYSFEQVRQNARHANLEETWNYFHGSAKKRIEAVEKIEKIDKAGSRLTTTLMPAKGILKTIIDITLETIGQNPENRNALCAIIENELIKRCEDYSCQGQYYTFREVMDKLGIGRTQTWERLKILEKEGLVKPVLIKKARVYPKAEVEHVASMVDTRKASVSFGYKEKVPTTLPGLANKGIIKSTKVGKLHFFEPAELVDHFYHKNSR